MKILLADRLHPSCISALEKLPGTEVINRPELSAETLPEAVKDIDILVVRSTRVTAETIAAARALSLIIRAGAGTNTIDVKAASARGIYVTNCPGKNSAAVAELTIGLMLALDRHIVENVQDLRAGKWNKKKYSKASGIKGRKLGIIGLGQIGLCVLERCRAFGMSAIAWSRSLTPERAAELGIEYASDPLIVAEKADVVTVHLALSQQTRSMIGAEFFSRMKPGAIFINTSRGEVVDEAALAEALRSGKILAGLDVFNNEPAASEAEFKTELATFSNLYGTHHIGASTDQAEAETGQEVVRIVQSFLTGDEIPNCVNLRKPPSTRTGFVIRHEDRVGVLASVFAVLKEHGCNVQEMQNQIFEGCQAASAKILLAEPPPAEVKTKLETCDGVLYVSSIT
ncbi:MAG: 3-phosphoglycerate dehydrogenase family protein [Acidobacteriota bacterium]|nr:3-phosphoglycerate dehydrogenase family protein [Blastocatellia bacterium]MDW8411189.1 3-phosphoglycerate dehydrogenase family protein [Acidobacteriota bacterium]